MDRKNIFITELKHLDFIKQYNYLKTKQLCELFNQTFNTNLTTLQISNIRHRDYNYLKFPVNNPEYIDFIQKNAPYCTSQQLAELFNKQFNTNYNRQALLKVCNDLKISLKKRGYAIGSIVPKHYKNGVPFKYLIKISDTGDYHKDWQELSRYYYTLYHGSIPKDHAIIFLDGNHLNVDKENLYAVHKNILGSLNVNIINNGFNPMDNGICTKAFCELLTTELILKGKYVYE